MSARWVLAAGLVLRLLGGVAAAAQDGAIPPHAQTAPTGSLPPHSHPAAGTTQQPTGDVPAVTPDALELRPREPAPLDPGSPAVAGGPWPSPVADDGRYSNVLFDVLEVQRVGNTDALRWDMVGWWGGDWRRLWVKSEANLYRGRDSGGQWDVQALYGKLISPFFDLQLGLRAEQHLELDADPTRVFAVLGLQGLAPYRIEVEPALFLSDRGKLSGRLTASHDTLLTQRLILQSRFETEVAAQRDEEFGVESGVNDAELGLRLRYEVRRELAPYVGLSYRRSLGAARERVLREGGDPNELQVAVGLRTWF